MTTACDHFRQQIGKALVDDLGAEERQVLEAHLAECPACRLDQELYTTTVRQLRSTADVPVPRHFFVYPETSELTPWRLFQQLNFTWRLVIVAVTIWLVVGAGILVSNVQFKSENGTYSLSFGKPLLPHPATMAGGKDTEALKHELLVVMEERLQRERLEFIHLVQAELKQSTTLSSQQQRQLLRAALESMETRFNNQLTSAGKALEARNDRALLSLIGAWQTQRERDLVRINASFDQMIAQGQLKERQTDNILNTLIQVAELKMQ
jgi:hypothetical protein